MKLASPFYLKNKNMKKHILSILLMMAGAIPAVSQTFVHDPVMAYEDSTYYLFSTGHYIQMMTSKDRKNWNIRKEGALPVIPVWTKSVPKFNNHIWAPDILQWHGKWWMAYSCSSFGVNTSAIGLASTDRLSDFRWRDEGCIIESKKGDKFNAIDPNFVIDETDQPWMTFGSFWDGIQMVRLDSTMHIKEGEKPVTIARRFYNNEPKTAKNPTSEHAGVNAIEAPFIFKHNGWYYLFASWDYCCRGEKSTYRVVVGRSRKVNGPYLDKNGVDMAKGGGSLVIKGDMKEFDAAGHCAAYHFPEDDIFICHGYNIPLQGASILIQKKIVWDNNDWFNLE